jgi:hypothetical protein
MALNPKRAEVVAEIVELKRRLLESNVDAAYIGWTPEEYAVHKKLHERIAVLRLELSALLGKEAH